MEQQGNDSIRQRAIKERRAYQREWRSKNRDAVKRYNAEYWERKAKREMQKEEGGEKL